MELLFLLQLKHWYVDFYDQTMDEVRSKGNYGETLGLFHSLKHAVATFYIFAFIDVGIAYTVFVLDFLFHYHIDWIKMNYGNRDINTPQFWSHLGLDQLAHQICYIGYVYILFLELV